MTNYFRKPDALVDAVRAVLSGQPNATQEEIKKEDQLDPVNHKALKGKHKDRKDKDIDNDGDVDSSDEYLHKKRKAISKSIDKDMDEACGKKHMKEEMCDKCKCDPCECEDLDESLKSLKRGLLGWDKNMTGLDGKKNTPQEMRRRIQKTDSDTLKRWTKQDNGSESAASVQGRMAKHELKKRGIKEETQLDESLPVTKDDPLVVIWQGATSPEYSAQGLMGHMNLSVANSIYRFGTNGVAEKLAKAGTGKRVKVGKYYLEYSEHNKTQMVKESKDEYEDDDDKKGKKKKGEKYQIDMKPSMDDQRMNVESVGKSLKNAILEARRGRPPKNKDAEGGLEHIQMQLRKSVSLRGAKDVEFGDGKKVKVPAAHAEKVLSKLDAIKAPRDRQNAVNHISKSHKNMMDFHDGKAGEMDPVKRRQDALKLK